MWWPLLAAAVVLFCFGFVLLFGAPYLPTLSDQVANAFELAELQPGQTLLELGCGDGKVLVAAAQQGYRVIGYELNPLLFVICWFRIRRYRRQAEVHWGNFWTQPWPQADVIFVFLLQTYMHKLDTKIMQSAPKPVKLVSVAFTIPGKHAVKAKGAVSLYDYRKA